MEENNNKLGKMWDIILGLIIIAGTAFLLYAAVNGANYRHDVQKFKLITYFCLAVFIPRVLYRVLSNRKKVNKYLVAIITEIIMSAALLLFNNMLHYLGFATMFNFPNDVLYKTFLMSDLRYMNGLGIIRYILFFVVSMMCFVFIEKGWHFAVWRRIFEFPDFSENSSDELELQEASDEERQHLIDILQNENEVDMAKYICDKTVKYVIEIPMQDKE